MADEQIEQGELTERFRAFSESKDPEPSRALPVAWVVVGVVAVIAVIAVVWLLLAQ